MKRKKLVIISHTEHYIKESKVVGWGATVNEINYLADFWEEVIHVACMHKTAAPNSSLYYTKNNIKFEPIPSYGGKGFWGKVRIITCAPKIIFTIFKSCKGASEVQLRLPTSMGLYLLPFFSFVIPRKFTFWIKYAGDWGQIKPPLANRIQRYWLKKNWSNCDVTINGFWKNQLKHCHSFENPCLTQEDIKIGKAIALEKIFEKPYNFCFVGRLDEVKGVSKLISSFRNVPLEQIKAIHLIGHGKEVEFYKKEAAFLGDKIIFHGFQEKNYVHLIMKTAHFFLLPSSAEGFPKVVAEAGCYGVIPIVSNVGSISHYINKSNGFVWDIKNKAISYEEVLEKAILTTPSELKQKSSEILYLAALFTFENYLKKINKYILN